MISNITILFRSLPSIQK